MQEIATTNSSAALAQYSDITHEYLKHAQAENTTKAYRTDWKLFVAWCDAHGVDSLPASPETVVAYLASEAQAGRATSTMQRRIASISTAHQMAKMPSPTHDPLVRMMWKSIRNVHGTAQEGKTPMVVEDLRKMADALALTSRAGLRDRAILVVSFAGAFRRSELVALNVEDLDFNDDGVTITIRRSKTDQEGEGRKVGLPYGSDRKTCPVRSLREWIDAAKITTGAVFRTVTRGDTIQSKRLGGQDVARIVKRTAEAAGLDPKAYSGHSPRAGFATSAAKAGKSERAIMKQTGHKSVQTVRRYIREGSLYIDNAAAGIGL